MECPKCNNIDKHKFSLVCTKAGMYVSYYNITCKVCGYTWEDRWQDDYL
jgi:transcription elongation factor Elf1